MSYFERAWLLEPRDTAGLAGTPFGAMPPPESLPRWEPAQTWPGGFIRSVELHRHLEEPGREGVEVTSSRLHDAAGPLGTLVQCLTVRPR